MPHRDVKEGNKEDEGPDHPALHAVQFLRRGVLPPGGGALLSRPLGQGGPIAGGGHRLHNGLRRDGGFVIGDLHGIAQQVHADLADALHLAHRFFHVGGAGGTGHTGYVESLFHR